MNLNKLGNIVVETFKNFDVFPFSETVLRKEKLIWWQQNVSEQIQKRDSKNQTTGLVNNNVRNPATARFDIVVKKFLYSTCFKSEDEVVFRNVKI